MKKNEAKTWIYNNNLGWVFPHYDKDGNFDYLACKAPPCGLKLPDGWHYDAKENVFTNGSECILAVYKG